MCFLLLFINNGGSEDEYQLIVGMNRDEHFARPTKPASIWHDTPTCVAGLDMKAGCEGGSWLAASSSGRIAALLNVMSFIDPSKKGRGQFVTNYVKDMSDCSNASIYMSNVIKNCTDYNNFHLVLIERKKGLFEVLNACSKEEDVVPNKLFDGCHALSNGTLSKPWVKTKVGKERFEDLMSKSCRTADKQLILEGISQILCDEKSHLPDPNLEAACEKIGICASRKSSICDTKPENLSKTRTQTVILVNRDGLCEYIEWTMCEPIQENWHENTWQTNKYSFRMTN
ncbi:transport and Golgi organization protein 2 homolog [Tubulanus polymorphus]|uniref:transport and Golgi organization protein 2 homolog n=1 Tax=Tubulanus polymorphus TaxID=672921 RepID=UPI003DA4AF9D